MARRKCNNCEYGGYDPCSDICDACMCDADTRWGGLVTSNGMKSNMKSYCNEMNKIISENKGNRIDLLNEVMAKVYAEGGELLWNRDVFISCNGNDKTMRDLVRYSDKVHFEPSDDPVEHPGVVVYYNEPLNL